MLKTNSLLNLNSSRIGNLNRNVNVLTSTISNNYASVLGGKYYEFTNHLGNVLTVFSDKKIPKDTDNNNIVDSYEIGIVSIADYSPFGVELDGRTESSWEYRYGFQNQEKDDEIKGEGNSVNYKYRMHDPRVGRFFAVDPLANQYSYNSTYSFSENKVIDGVELEGLEFKKRIAWNDVNKSMYQLKNNPESINQTGAGTCTMAAINYIWIKRDFNSFHRAVTGLYFIGKAQVNNFRIEPDANLFWVHPDNSRNSMNAPYDFGATEDLATDWIILSSLQNSLHPDKEFYGYGTGRNSEAGNNREDLRFMMKNLLGLSNINYKYYDENSEARQSMNPKQVLSNLEGLKSEGNEIVMSINANMLDSRANGAHSVTYLGNYKDLGDGIITFDVQSWGEKMSVTTSIEKFKENYNGASWGK